MFAKFSIPEKVIFDGGPQFLSFAFQNFAKCYEFCHTFSSPKYAQSNWRAERAVQTVKNLLKISHDPYFAFLEYRTSPHRCGYSPAELVMVKLL